MGLDSIELVLATEAEFGIAIDDNDAANLSTPRLLTDYVFTRLGVEGSSKQHCLSQAAFYQIRSVLIRQFGALRKEVQLSSPINYWLKGDIREQWKQLASATGMTQLPRLQCRKSIYYPLTLGLPFAGAILLVMNHFPSWSALLALFVLWTVANIATDKRANIIPPSVNTVERLIPYVTPTHREEWSRDYVLQRIIQITSIQLGIPVEKIHPDHHFVKDLGID